MTDIYHGWNYFVGGVASNARLDLYYSRGTNFYHIQQFYGRTLGFVGSIPFDLNGDGRTDLVNRNYYGDPFDIFYFRPNGKEHLLEKVANGHGHTTEWTYKRLNEEGAFYQRGNLENDAFNNIQLPMYAVSELKAQNGIGGVSTVQYAYEEAKIHKRGKGFMGFKKSTASNLTMGVRTVTEMQFNSYPLAAALYQTSSYLIANGQLLNQNTFNNEFVTYGSQFGADKRYWQRVNSSTQNNAFEGRTVSSTYNYDSDGNVTQSTTNNNNVETTTTTTAYGAFATPVPARPTSVTIAKTLSGQPSYSISSIFGYNGIGQLTSKTEFAGQAKSVTTTYGYNNLGNLTNTTVNPSGMAARSSSMAYDDKGRYATSTTNVLGQTATTNYDPRWGKATSTTGIDGLTTTYEYDTFGRTRNTNLPEGYSITQNYGWDFANGAVYFTYVQHPGKPDTKTWYDVLGRELRTETEGYQGQWTIQTKTYNARGNVASSTQPYKNGENVLTTTTQYDAYNRPTSTGNSAFGTTSIAYAYNGGNLTTTTTNSAGQTTSKTTDAAGLIVSATDQGGTLQYTYNSQGNLLTTTKDGNTLSSSEYDAYTRQTRLNDPNAGSTTYGYDALGQLTTQTNAAGQATTVQYDVAGRTTTRQAPEGTTTYEYYGNGSGAATSQLRKTTGFAGNLVEYNYDNLGRLSQQKETIDGTDYTSTYGYNAYGDLTAKNYPSGFGTRHEYDANGYPTTIRNHDNNVTLYTNSGMSPLGGNTAYTLGNGRSSSVEHYYGMPTRYTTNGLQDLQLTWNYQTGNLNQRKDHRAGREENFQYDNLNRLTSAQVAGQAAVVVQYDNGGQRTGNINNKTDMGSYAYASNRPNALTSISNPQNAVPNVAQTIAYTPFSQPSTLTENGYELGYTYDADHQRMRGILKQNGNETNRRYYLGDYEKDISNGITRHLHYVSSPAGLIAIVVRENGNDTYYYTYTDHLGSILTLTNSSGNVVAEQSFDAWGRRRDVNSWTSLPPTATPPSGVGGLVWLTRGYTGHEHLDPFGLINMNGRLYDPALGRMLSVDNYVVGAAPSQAHNRYTYAFNNPLLYNDPDGEHPILIAMAVGAIISAGSYTVGVMMSPGGFHDNWSWKSFGLSALQGAIAGAVSYGIGGAFPIAGKGVEGAISNMLAHGVAGAGQAALFGGNAGQGFVTGFASAGFSIGAGAAGLGAIGQLAAGGLSGGVSNSLAGGNFWEGFGRGLIVSGLNHIAHQAFYDSQLKKMYNVLKKSAQDYQTADEFYESIGGDLGDWAAKSPEQFRNTCAARLSKALNYGGFEIPRGTSETYLGGDGKYYFINAKSMYNYLSNAKVWGKPVQAASISKVKNAVIFQTGFSGGTSGHLDIIYRGMPANHSYPKTTYYWH